LVSSALTDAPPAAAAPTTAFTVAGIWSVQKNCS
jgi:hypothetical protein